MFSRRIVERRVVGENGMIALDEHTAVACSIFDRSSAGLRITMSDTSGVPDTFLLYSATDVTRACVSAWRTQTEIGASFSR